MDNIQNLITLQYKSRLERKSVSSIKVNLYKGYEVEAVALALDDLANFGTFRFPDCVMVGDSYLMTHLGMDSTRLRSQNLDLFLRVYLDTLYEVHVAMRRFLGNQAIYLIADMPDGSYQDEASALRNAESMLRYGADVVKIEIDSDDKLKVIETLSKHGICIMAHLGYTPQVSKNRIYGKNYSEAQSIFSLARLARDSGACAIVLERVTEIVNRLLCIPRENALPIYSIFSGRAEYGGQSLNVWDAVFRPSFPAKFFPPTASFETSDFPGKYTVATIREKFAELLRITLENKFPLSPKRSMSANDIEKLLNVNPWVSQ